MVNRLPCPFTRERYRRQQVEGELPVRLWVLNLLALLRLLRTLGGGGEAWRYCVADQ